MPATAQAAAVACPARAAGRRLQLQAPAAAAAGRRRRQRHPARRLVCSSAEGQEPFIAGEPSLFTLPVFPLPAVLHPSMEGVLQVFEPKYLQLFSDLLRQHPEGRGARFLHVLAPRAAPPALLESTVGGLPRVGCCAEVQAIETRADGTLAVRYSGARRVQLLMVERHEPYATVAVEHYDDAPTPDLDPTVDVLEKEAAQLLQRIQALSAVVDPSTAALPEAVRRYGPPAAVARKTSYDALKAAGHQAATHIDVWRRHGSVYKTAQHSSAAAADPYEAVREALSKGRRQELFSFAVAQLLVMGIPERTALLLSQDTGARLNFVLAALRPYLLELQAKASLKRQLG